MGCTCAEDVVAEILNLLAARICHLEGGGDGGVEAMVGLVHDIEEGVTANLLEDNVVADHGARVGEYLGCHLLLESLDVSGRESAVVIFGEEGRSAFHDGLEGIVGGRVVKRDFAYELLALGVGFELENLCGVENHSERASIGEAYVIESRLGLELSDEGERAVGGDLGGVCHDRLRGEGEGFHIDTLTLGTFEGAVDGGVSFRVVAACEGDGCEGENHGGAGSGAAYDSFH